MRTASRSAADIEEVGWPEPAAADARTESTRSCWPSSRRKSVRSPMTSGARANELIPLALEVGEQLAEGLRELLHPLALERLDDVVVVDAGGREGLERAPRGVDVVVERALDASVVCDR